MKLAYATLLPASAPGGGDSVFTLTLDDLLTRFAEYDQVAASIVFDLETQAGQTAVIYLDSSEGSGNATNTILDATALAGHIETALKALPGYDDLVSVSGQSSEAGDKYDFTITFDASLGAVSLGFGENTQLHPTITLVENVVTEGEDEVAAEVHTVTAQPIAAIGLSPNGGTWKPSAGSSEIAYNADGPTTGAAVVASGWENVDANGGIDGLEVTFTNGVQGDVGNLEPVNVSLTAPEITHSITPA